MSFLPTLVTVAPATEPVSDTEAKDHLRIDGTDSDAWLDLAIPAARKLVEKYTGTKLITQTVVMRCSDWCDLIDLPVAPLASVSSVAYLDTTGTEQTLSTDVYEAVLIGLEPHIRLKVNQSWPSLRCATDAIRVTAVAGASSAEEEVKQAIVVTLAAWDEARSMGGLPDAAMALLENSRRF